MLVPKLFQGGLLLAVLSFSGLKLWAEEEAVPCGPECQSRVAAKWEQAEQSVTSGDYAAAAQHYEAVIQEEPLSIISQDASFRGGKALQEAGRHADAVRLYDIAISIANARASETGTKAMWLKKIKRAALFQRAKALEQAGQQEAATQAHQQAIDNAFADFSAVSTAMKQENARTLQEDAMQLGQDLEQGGDLPQAIAVYDRIIAIGDTRADTADGENVFAILDAKRDALFKKADACRRAGRTDDARLAIQQIRAEFPVSSAAVQIGIVEAQLDGNDTHQAELLVAKELQAKPILDEAIEAAGEGTYGVDAIHPVTCAAGQDGSMLVHLKIKAGQGDQNLWNLWIDDANGSNLARCYGSGTMIRGRIGVTSNVTEKTLALTGEWDDLQIKIVPAAHMTEFLLNEKSFGVLSHTGAGATIGRIRIERIDNLSAAGDFVDFDDLTVSGKDTTGRALVEDFSYPNGGLNANGGWTGQAEQEIAVVQGVLRVKGGRYERSLRLLEQIVQNYPDTSANLIALDKKARLLTHLKRFDEAHAGLVAVLDHLRPASSRSEFFQTARVRLKRLRSDWIAHDLYAGNPVNEDRYDLLRQLCSEIIAQDTRPDERAQAHNSIAESFAWQRRFTESLAVAETFLSEHDPIQFPSQTAWAHLYAGIGCQEVGRYDDSLTHLRWLTVEHPGFSPQSSLGQELAPHAYYRIWNGLRLSGAAKETVSQAFGEYAAKFPKAAKAVKHLQIEQ